MIGNKRLSRRLQNTLYKKCLIINTLSPRRDNTSVAGSEPNTPRKRNTKLLSKRTQLSDSDVICFSTLPEPTYHVFPAKNFPEYAAFDDNGNEPLTCPDEEMPADQMVGFAKLDQVRDHRFNFISYFVFDPA